MIIDSLPGDVTWFSSSQVGAPEMMGGSNGDLLTVLDAVLVDGYNQLTAISIDAEPDRVTLNFLSGHGFLGRQIVAIEGATNSQLNGRHRPIEISSTSITLDVSGVVDEVGVISVKVAPLGWENIFGKADPLRRAYRSKSQKSSKRVLYLDMNHPSTSGYHETSPAKRASVSICQDMQVLGEQIGSVTDNTNDFATNPNGNLFWYQKRDYLQSKLVPNTRSPWKVIGNEGFFYINICWSSYFAGGGTFRFDSTIHGDLFGFGEYARIGDTVGDNTFLMAAKAKNDADNVYIPTFGSGFGPTDTVSFRIFTMTPSGFDVKYLSALTNATNVYKSGFGPMPYPNGTGSALFSHSLRIGRNTDDILGIMPAMLFLENNISTNGTISAHDSSIVDDVLLVHIQGAHGQMANSAYFGFYLGGG